VLGAGTTAAAADRHVLLIYDERTSLPGLAAIDAGLVEGVTGGSLEPIEIYREALDLSRFGSTEGHRQRFADYLHGKYSTRPLDLVVAVMGPSLTFLLDHGDGLFPGTPIVFCGVDRRDLGDRTLSPRVTGVFLEREFAPTVEIALRLQPEVERVVFVAGSSEFDRRLLTQARDELAAFDDRLAITWLTDQSLPDVLARVGQLPPRTVVLYSTMFRDEAGTAMVPHEVAARIATAANAPVYAFLDQYLGSGIVGGRLYSLETHGAEAARLALRVLGGASPASVPPRAVGSSVTAFDFRQLERWGLREDRLPAGSVVLHRPPSIWRDHRRVALGGLAAIVVLGVLSALLLIQYGRRRWAERGLRESDLRLHSLADNAPVMLWLSDAHGALAFVNRSWIELTGAPAAEQTGRQWIDHLHPEDAGELWELQKESAASGTAFSAECRLRARDDSYRWFLVTLAPRFAADDSFAGFVGSGMDQTAQRQAAQENQRTRDQLAHVARVVAMGELTASVAHELKQPLTAIRANAQAGQILLDREHPPLDEFREILAEICADDRRAGEIIDRLRGLLVKNELVRVPLAMNEAVEEVLRLLRIEASAREVMLSFEPAEDLPKVAADRVHLQQVLVNLVLNGIEAMDDVPVGERCIAVRTARSGEGGVELTVTDGGPGLTDDLRRRLFEPFLTTKKNGLGLGLSISRSIVASHGGRIWSERIDGGGERFHVVLPALVEAPRPRLAMASRLA
jgi:PAS domain S-box-containing protein